MDNELSREEIEKRLSWFSKRYGPYIEKRGLSNWRNLFRRPTISEWMILVMLLLVGFMGWAYQEDVSTCRETLTNLDSICIKYCELEFQNARASEDRIFTVDTSEFTGDNIIKADNELSHT
jgi:hypothetical protein